VNANDQDRDLWLAEFMWFHRGVIGGPAALAQSVALNRQVWL
jgi:hypothetical protein